MKKVAFCLFFLFCFGGIKAFSQDSLYAREVIKTLTSAEFHGRGYAFKGDSLAARYIEKEYRKYNLSAWNNNYFQRYTVSMNVFEGKADVDFGKSYLSSEIQIAASSASIKGKFPVVAASEKMLDKKYTQKHSLADKMVAVDLTAIEKEEQKTEWAKIVRTNTLKAKGYITVNNSLPPYSPVFGRMPALHTTLVIVKDSIKKPLKTVSLDIESHYIPNYNTQNVCAYVEGKTYPDTFFVIGAHYDHLGQTGDRGYFPGANDNASGVAMLLDLARYFSLPENQPDYSIAFLAFSGEEIGLLGSTYFVEHPLFPLENIKMMLNLDLVGTGEDGFVFVCGIPFEEEYKKIEALNNKKKYAPKLLPREAARNSDHFPFYDKGCKTLFIYGMGKSGRYHHHSDTLENLSLGGYNHLFRLIVDYIQLSGL
ncbi:MAG: M28 family peptidase [Bacteroidales bacterium]|jgi:hypothetical protein|nr:M28 family peptidase [Bacteroidales bacterium]